LGCGRDLGQNEVGRSKLEQAAWGILIVKIKYLWIRPKRVFEIEIPLDF
jgi:hypothetical protein